MSTASSGASESIWASEDEAKLLRRRAFHFWNPDYLERVALPILEPPEGAQVLDVGSGYGCLTLPLARARPDLWITGLDAEAKAVAEAAGLAQNLGATNVNFVEGDANALPFVDSSFDLVCCQTLLTHVPEPERVLAEMVRVLKPGGHLFVVEYHHLGAFSLFDDAVAEDLEGRLERFRFSQLYIEGKKHLGRGDDTFGVRVPFVVQDMGLEVLDVRKNDRAWHAFSPYHKENERIGLAVTRDFAEPTGETMRAWTGENLRAGGANGEDVRRYFELTDDPKLKAGTRDRIDAGTYRYLSSFTFYLTFARKPVSGS